MSRPTLAPGRRVLPVISAVTFLSVIDSPLLIPIMALYATDLGAGVGTIGLIVGLHSIVSTPASIFFGRLMDRVGYRAPLVAGLIGDAVSLFLYTISTTPVHLVLVRMLHGFSSAAAGPATMSMISDYAVRTARGRIMALYGISIATANAVGYGASAVIARQLSYQAIFLTGSALLAVAAILALLLPGGRVGQREVRRITLAENLRQISRLLVRRGLSMSYAAIFAQYFVFGGLTTLLPLYVKGYGMTAFHVGMLLMTFTVVFILSQYPSGLLSDKVGRVKPTIAGLGLAVVSLAFLPALSSFPLLAVSMAFYGLAYGSFFPSISASVAEHASQEERGLATGIFYAALTGGVAIGAPLMGGAGQVMGLQRALFLAPVIMLLALAVLLGGLTGRARQR